MWAKYFNLLKCKRSSTENVPVKFPQLLDYRLLNKDWMIFYSSSFLYVQGQTKIGRTFSYPCLPLQSASPDKQIVNDSSVSLQTQVSWVLPTLFLFCVFLTSTYLTVTFSWTHCLFSSLRGFHLFSLTKSTNQTGSGWFGLPRTLPTVASWNLTPWREPGCSVTS